MWRPTLATVTFSYWSDSCQNIGFRSWHWRAIFQFVRTGTLKNVKNTQTVSVPSSWQIRGCLQIYRKGENFVMVSDERWGHGKRGCGCRMHASCMCFMITSNFFKCLQMQPLYNCYCDFYVMFMMLGQGHYIHFDNKHMWMHLISLRNQQCFPLVKISCMIVYDEIMMLDTCKTGCSIEKIILTN